MTETLTAERAARADEPAWMQRFRAARIMFPQWARDNADRLIYLSNSGGKFEVQTWDRKANVHRRLTDRSEGTGYRVPSRLEPSGERVWWFDDAKGNELGHWVRERFEGGGHETIAPQLAPSYSAGLALGRDFAIVGRSTGLEGSTVHLVRDGVPPRRIYSHQQSASVGELSRDEALFVLAHSEHGDNRNRAIRILDVDGQVVADIWDGPGKGLSLGDWSPVKGDQRVIIGHDRDGVRRPMVYDVTAKREIPVQLDLPGEVAATRWYPDGKALLIVHDHRGRSELYRYELASGVPTKLDTQPGSIDGARVRPNGEVWYMLDRSSEPAVVRDLGGAVVLQPAGQPAPAGVAYAGADVDGVHIFIAQPPDKGPHPTYFYIHGGPEWHDSDTFSPTVQAWVDHGFAVVLVNYRGSTGYGKAWRDAIVGRPGLTELEDVAKARAYVIAKGIADPKRCVISGGSWGGYLTLLGLGVQPEAWALGVGIVPIGDYIPAYEDEMEPLKKYDAALFGGTPTEVPEKYARSNPITYVADVRVPVFLLVGQNDPRCPSRSVDVYVERLKKLGKPYEEYRYDAGHGSLVVDESLKQLAMEIDFVARYLGTPAAESLVPR
jgi:dipeptidyl aminopeptidase/acylaminoacyl peptidase